MQRDIKDTGNARFEHVIQLCRIGAD